MPPDQEIEAKFRVTDTEALSALRTDRLLVSRYPLSEATLVVNEDTYFDSADLRLLRNGRTLRLRTEDDQTLATVKSLDMNTPKGVHKRLEVERPFEGEATTPESLRLRMLPDDIASALADTVGEKDRLARLVRLRQQRLKRGVYRPGEGGALLGELSLDHVEVLTPDRAGDWVVACCFDAVELEVAEEVSAAELKPLAAEIAQIAGLKADAHNKLHQALICVNEALVPDEADAHRVHVAELCRTVWRSQLLVMLLNEAGVRESADIEYVHDMRVATRRARAAGRLYGGFFATKSRRVPRFMRLLRRTGQLLGQVRDMDVALDNLARYRAERQGVADEGLDALAAHWQEQRENAHGALLRWLNGAKYLGFLTDLGAFCARPGRDVAPIRAELGAAPTPHQVRHVLPSMIMSRYESIRAFEVLFDGGEEVPVPTLHALRIECKYLRYHLEFNVGLMGPEGQALIAELKALQEHLGLLNDASVANALLADASKSISGAGIEGYKQRQIDAVERLRGDVPGDLTRFLSEETRRTLALSLARI